MVKIEKGIPAPARGLEKYPFPLMKVGDSFLTPTSNPNARNAAYMYGSRSGKKFVARQTDAGIRIWRVK
jgi:hypothetical protein